MDCAEFRKYCAADPDGRDPVYMEHAQGCSECRIHRARALRDDEMIRRALSLPMRSRETQATRPRSPRRVALAASWVLGLGVAVTAWFSEESYSYALGRDALEHVGSEPVALESARAVPTDTLAKVLAPHELQFLGNPAAVTFAELCVVRGQVVPHVVVRGPSGPLTVLIFPEAPVLLPVNIEADGLHGRVVRWRGRTVAVVAEGSLPPQAADAVTDAFSIRF